MAEVFIVQAYKAKAGRLVGEAARFFPDEGSARRAGGSLARFRAGVVVASQRLAPSGERHGVPVTLVVHGCVPEEWNLARAA